MAFYNKIIKKSIWVFHVSASPCNNCDIEILDLITPGYDVERFGIKLIGSVRHADILLVTGVVSYKVAPRIKQLYEQASKPLFVVGIGTCTAGGATFKTSYNKAGIPLEKVIPVNAYVPGCPPKPEAMIDGIVKLLGTLK